MMGWPRAVLIAFTTSVTVAVVAAQDRPIDFVSTLAGAPDGGRSIGLQKLTADERAALNDVLNRVYVLGRQNAAPSPQPTRPTTEAPSLSGYVTRIDSDSSEVVKLANGAVVQVTSGTLGYLGRKSAVLFTSRGTCRLWIQGKRTYRCDLIAAPSGRSVPAVFTSISSVSRNGEIIKTLDGAIFQVDGLYTIYTSLWLPVSEIALLGESQMVNLDQGDEIIAVSRVR